MYTQAIASTASTVCANCGCVNTQPSVTHCAKCHTRLPTASTSTTQSGLPAVIAPTNFVDRVIGRVTKCKRWDKTEEWVQVWSFDVPLVRNWHWITLEFRVEMRDPQGNVIFTVPVYMRGLDILGSVEDGDEVEIDLPWSKGQSLPLSPRIVRNLTTNTDVIIPEIRGIVLEPNYLQRRIGFVSVIAAIILTIGLMNQDKPPLLIAGGLSALWLAMLILCLVLYSIWRAIGWLGFTKEKPAAMSSMAKGALLTFWLLLIGVGAVLIAISSTDLNTVDRTSSSFLLLSAVGGLALIGAFFGLLVLVFSLLEDVLS